jgi:predicted AAA+ superfamily ATPase
VITRDVWKNIEKRLFKGKVIILIGARQVGKTTLLKTIESSKKKIIRINADEPDVQAIFENPTSTFLKNEFGHLKILIIDEAQRIPNIGLKLKLITDEIKTLQVIATGSSSFDLANQVNEPLTGRKWEFHLFPVSFQEMARYHGRNTEKRLLSHRLVYGYYPEIVLSHMDAKSLLKQISDSYLYKDLDFPLHLNRRLLSRLHDLMPLLYRHPQKLTCSSLAENFEFLGSHLTLHSTDSISNFVELPLVFKRLVLLSNHFLIEFSDSFCNDFPISIYQCHTFTIKACFYSLSHDQCMQC